MVCPVDKGNRRERPDRASGQDAFTIGQTGCSDKTSPLPREPRIRLAGVGAAFKREQMKPLTLPLGKASQL